MFGSIISTVGSLIGGAMNRSSASKTNAANDAYNRNKIRWLVHDAKKAGIHPLAALGSPVSGSAIPQQASTAMGDAVGEGAARFGRGIDAAQERKDNAELRQVTIDAERARIRNLDASTAATLATAQSRTAIAAARRGGQTLDVANLPHPNPGSVTIKKLSGVPYDDGTTGIDTPTPILVAGRRVVRDPTRWSSAQKGEDEFGETMDFVNAGSLAEAYMRDAMWEQSVRESLARARLRNNRVPATYRTSRGLNPYTHRGY